MFVICLKKRVSTRSMSPCEKCQLRNVFVQFVFEQIRRRTKQAHSKSRLRRILCEKQRTHDFQQQFTNFHSMKYRFTKPNRLSKSLFVCRFVCVLLLFIYSYVCLRKCLALSKQIHRSIDCLCVCMHIDWYGLKPGQMWNKWETV